MRSVAAVDEQLRQLYLKWFERVPRHELEFFRELLDDDYVYIDIFGVQFDKDGYLGLVSHITPDTTFELKGLRTRVVQGVTMVHGEYSVSGSYDDGRDVTSDTKFTSGWIEDSRGWRVLFHHATRVLNAEESAR